jgi:nucleotide-binding universal stress UspA family protein
MKVLVSLDSGAGAERIIRTLGSWAVDAKAEMHLLTVVQPGHLHDTAAWGNPEHALTPAATVSGQLLYTGEPPLRLAETRAQAITRAHTEVEDNHRRLAATYLAGTEWQSHVEIEDDIAPTILKAAAQIGADLVAMGTHGRSGISHLLMGSVAENVMRNATVPVLVVGPKSESGEPAR